MTIHIFLTILASLAGLIFLVVVFILIARVSITIAFCDDEGFMILVSLLGIKIVRFPAKEKKVKLSDYSPKKPKKKKKTAPKKKKEAEPQPEKPKKKLSVTHILNIVKELLHDFFGSYSRQIVVKVAKLHIRVATDDAASTAVLYGAVIQGVSYILAILDGINDLKPLKEKDVCVVPDFTSEQFSADIKIVLRVPIRIAVPIVIKLLRLGAGSPGDQ